MSIAKASTTTTVASSLLYDNTADQSCMMSTKTCSCLLEQFVACFTLMTMEERPVVLMSSSFRTTYRRIFLREDFCALQNPAQMAAEQLDLLLTTTCLLLPTNLTMVLLTCLKKPRKKRDRQNRPQRDENSTRAPWTTLPRFFV